MTFPGLKQPYRKLRFQGHLLVVELSAPTGNELPARYTLPARNMGRQWQAKNKYMSYRRFIL